MNDHNRAVAADIAAAFGKPSVCEDRAGMAALAPAQPVDPASGIADDIQAISRIDAIGSILEVVCRITGMGFAAVARVTQDRWIACAVRDGIALGLTPGGELSVQSTICDEIRASGRGVVIDHVDQDQQFRDHSTPRMYGFQSYISMPIVLPDGRFFGTLCALDPQPAKLNRPEIVAMFKNFADLIALQLDAQERSARQEKALLSANEAAELREQFVAVLAHDLRNPLAAINSGANILLRRELDEKTQSVAVHIQQSVARMGRLIDDMLDFARGRLGGGFPLERVADVALAECIDQVLGEFRDAWPNRIEADIQLDHAVSCDPNRIAQLVSNLVGNALKHGAAGRPIRVRASTDDPYFELSVLNEGEAIDPAILERLFLPFFRGSGRHAYQGLGLGLYIASEIARAHGGAISVRSSADETCFTLRIPRG